MSLDNCIPALTASGDVSPERAAEFQALYDEIKAAHAKKVGMAAAAQMASDDVIKAIKQQNDETKRAKLIQMKVQLAVVDDLARFKSKRANAPRDAIFATVVNDSRAPYLNAEKLAAVIRNRAHGLIGQIINDLHSHALTGEMQNKALALDILRAAMGDKSITGAAKVMATAWHQATEMLRRRFNAAGGRVPFMENWFPQSHDSILVGAVTKDEWIASIWDRLDRGRMLDKVTGFALDDDKLRAVLGTAYDTITTQGWSKRALGQHDISSFVSRHGDARILHFKSADDWMAYHEQFGSKSPFDAMMQHIESLSRDIALMERFGPNPQATIDMLKDLLVRDSMASPNKKVRKNAARDAGNLQSLYDELAGSREPMGNETLAQVGSAVRNFEVSVNLGGAVIAAQTDHGFGMLTRAFNGLPMRKQFADYAKTFAPGSAEDRELAMYMGFGAQEMAGRAAASMRIFGEQVSTPVTGFLADRTIRLSGLSRHTNSGQWASGFGFVAHMTMMRGKRFDQLGRFKGALERYGIDEAGWNIIRQTPLEERGGVPFIIPTQIQDQAVGDNVLRMILTEANFATPVIDLRTRNIVNSNLPLGTPIGELVRSSPILFKTFGIGVLATHGRRMYEMENLPAALGYYVTGAVLTTAFSALALEMRAIKDGKTRSAMTPEFWANAYFASGSASIPGDFLAASFNRGGKGPAEYWSGVSLGTLGAVTNMAVSNTGRAIDDDPDTETRWGKDAIKIGKRNIPVASSLFYSKLAFDRFVVDTLNQSADPDVAKSNKRLRDYADERGEEYFFGPGDSLSDAKTPDWSNIWEQPE